jgi:phospholipase/lecithinase/hemolysin
VKRCRVDVVESEAERRGEMTTRHLARAALVAALFASVAAAGYGQPYTGVHVFGNSHADVGNIFIGTGGFFPPSPPYFEGRFSNGPAFVDVAADNLSLGPVTPSLAGGTVYAWGGALSLLDEPNSVPSVRSQVEGYLAAVGEADSEALYVLEGGGNDLSYALWTLVAAGDWEGAEAFLEQAAQGMVGSLQMLADAGAVHFVVLNAAYLSETGWFCGDVNADILVEHYDTALEEGLSTLNGDLRVMYFDLATFGRSVSEHFITGCQHCVPFLAAGPVCSDPDVLFYWDDVHFSAPVHQLMGDALTVAILQDEVRHLRAAGTLSKGRAKALLTKLEGAYEKLGERKPKTAVNKVRAFANQVKAFVRTGRLSGEQAELLLVGARGIVDQP